MEQIDLSAGKITQGPVSTVALSLRTVYISHSTLSEFLQTRKATAGTDPSCDKRRKRLLAQPLPTPRYLQLDDQETETEECELGSLRLSNNIIQCLCRVRLGELTDITVTYTQINYNLKEKISSTEHSW